MRVQVAQPEEPQPVAGSSPALDCQRKGNTMASRDIPELVGRTVVNIQGAEKGSEQIVFTLAGGARVRMYHYQDCCENVAVEDICGDIADLVGCRIVRASEDAGDSQDTPDGSGTQTWTFYNLATERGHVTIRWLGESNGYYSEAVTIEVSPPKGTP